MIRGMSDQPGKILLELVIDTCHWNEDLKSVVHCGLIENDPHTR